MVIFRKQFASLHRLVVNPGGCRTHGCVHGPFPQWKPLSSGFHQNGESVVVVSSTVVVVVSSAVVYRKSILNRFLNNIELQL